MRSHPLPRLLACLAFLGFAASFASAAEILPEPFACGDGLFDWKSGGGDENHPSNNVSGVDCEAGGGGGWSCVGVADEGLSVTTFTVATDGTQWSCRPGRALDPATSLGCLGGGGAERDFEGASLHGGVITATGSWGMSRKKGELRGRNWTLMRKDLGKPDADGCEVRDRSGLKAFIAAIGSAELDGAVDRTLQCGGLNIEGFEAAGDRLFFGLRSPSERDAGIAYIIEAPEAALFGTPTAGQARLHKIAFAGADGQPVKGIGIRGLEAVGDRLVLLTGDAGAEGKQAAVEVSGKPEHGCPDLMAKDPPYPNREAGLTPMIWVWTPGDAAARQVAVLGGDYAHAKAEGITVITDSQGKASALLSIDAPKKPQSQLAIIRDLALP